jgi:hypothetical protein
MTDKPCLFCLEPVKTNEQARDLIGCQCDVISHIPCMEKWYETKHTLECPICHTVSVPNMSFHRVREYVITVIEQTREEIEEQERRRRGHERCIGLCCGIMITMAIVVNLIEYFSH